VGEFTVRAAAGKATGKKLHAEPFRGLSTTLLVVNIDVGKARGTSDSGVKQQNAEWLLAIKIGIRRFVASVRGRRIALGFLALRVAARRVTRGRRSSGWSGRGSRGWGATGGGLKPRSARRCALELAKSIPIQDSSEVRNKGIRDIKGSPIIG
jgi:hypothetical protein